MLKPLALAAVLMLTSGTVLAQEKQAEPAAAKAESKKLAIGDRAPALEVEAFVKGEPITGFEKGKVYVVEFWATWCGPCIQSMPHISALQAEYKDRGLTVVGVNVWEDKEYNAETLKKVREFVAEQGERMGYTVAFDGGKKKMDEAYMKAAGRNGIPSAFIVDQNATIAWMGHPMQMDPVLEEVVAGTWDSKTGPEKLKQAGKAFRDAAQLLENDPKAGIEAWTKAEQEYPKVAKTMLSTKFHMFLGAQQWDGAYAAATQIVDKAIKQKNGAELNEVAWTIVDPEANVSNKNLDIALRAAMKADEFSGGKDPAVLDTLARVYFVKGEKAKAIEFQAKAVDLAKKSKNEGIKEMAEDLQKTLDEYKSAK